MVDETGIAFLFKSNALIQGFLAAIDVYRAFYTRRYSLCVLITSLGGLNEKWSKK